GVGGGGGEGGSGEVWRGWASGRPATIARANLDGTGVDPTFITGAESALGIALDSGHIYWTNRDQLTPTIGRASLDGTGVNQNFVNIGSGFPDGIAVDSGHIYWVNSEG